MYTNKQIRETIELGVNESNKTDLETGNLIILTAIAMSLANISSYCLKKERKDKSL